MHELNRRVFITGSMTTIGSAMILTNSAQAGFLSDVVDGVAHVAIQGANFAAKPVQELIKTGAGIANTALQGAGVAINRATDLANSMIQQAPAVANQFASMMAGGPAEMFFHANGGFVPQQPSFFITQANRALDFVTSSIDDEIRQDPFGYVQRNGPLLIDYALQYPQRYPYSVGVPAGMAVPGYPVPQQVQSSGFYPSAMSFAQMAQLASLFFA